MKKINVCVFPAQNESSVEINNALSLCEGINTYGVTPVRGHNEYNYINYCCDMPAITDEHFIETFERFIMEKNIDVVFPTNDSAVVFFAKNKDKFSAAIVNADYESAVICNNKKMTYQCFSDYVFCPTVYNQCNIFPCFIKPSEGEGAIGAKCINKREEIPLNLDLTDYVILEYLPGKEMTVDCITNAKGDLIAVLPRTRDKVFSGMSVYGKTVDPTPDIMFIAETINMKLHLNGLWYFQVKQDEYGKYKLLEISMRCAGTMCQSRARGFNLPLLSVYSTLGQDIAVIDNGYEVTLDRTLFARYSTDVQYDTVYIDYDGTIVVKNKVCLSVIRFLYQCKNEQKHIVLISRHNEDHDNTLIDDMKKHGIAESLFDEIVTLPFTQEKYSVMRDKNAIFIDNSYLERKKVHDKIEIPVFGIEGLDALQNWKI